MSEEPQFVLVVRKKGTVGEEEGLLDVKAALGAPIPNGVRFTCILSIADVHALLVGRNLAPTDENVEIVQQDVIAAARLAVARELAYGAWQRRCTRT